MGRKVINRGEAQKLIEKELSKSTVDCCIIEDETLERAWGWVFFYQSKEYIQTGDLQYMLAGNAPYIVNRSSGKVTLTGTAYAIEEYIQAYEDTL